MMEERISVRFRSEGKQYDFDPRGLRCLPGDGLIEQIYPEGVSLSSKASLSFTPPFCAALQTALCTRLLVGRPLETGHLYVADLMDMEIERLF